MATIKGEIQFPSNPQGDFLRDDGTFSTPSTTGTAAEYNETPTGLVNGVNATYTSTFNFIPETVRVYLNGLIQRKPTDYNTSGNDTILFTTSPETGDEIRIHYERL